jgi:septal ring-binding cell division protein DamX
VFEFGFYESSLAMQRTILSVFILIPLLTSCGLTDRFFTTNECEDDNCRAPVLLDNSNVEKKWFCYGAQEGENWDCQNERDPTKITTIQPKPEPSRAQPRATVEMLEATVDESQPAKATLSATQFYDNEIISYPRDHYAVQLIALRDLEGVQEYAGLNGIQEPKIVKIRNDQTDWYVILLGVYPERSVAESAREDWLTAKVLRVQPWIRQLGPLQDAIMAAEG